MQCTNADLDFAGIEFVLLSASVCIANLRGLDLGENELLLWSVFCLLIRSCQTTLNNFKTCTVAWLWKYLKDVNMPIFLVYRIICDVAIFRAV